MSPGPRVIVVLIAAASLTLLLAGCTPTVTPATTATTAVASTGSTPAPSASAAPAASVEANIADYLLDGTPYVADSNGEWSGHYGFWTDASHAVACDIDIYSGDSGGVSCWIAAGHGTERTYVIPAGASNSCDESSSNPADGTGVAINYKVFGSDADSKANVGFSGCLYQVGSDPTVDPNRKVLPPNTNLTVTQTGFETYTCSVASAVATCSDSAPGSSFVFGLSVATFHQG